MSKKLCRGGYIPRVVHHSLWVSKIVCKRPGKDTIQNSGYNVCRASGIDGRLQHTKPNWDVKRWNSHYTVQCTKPNWDIKRWKSHYMVQCIKHNTLKH